MFNDIIKKSLEEFEKILDEIIENEENGEMNCAYYKQTYLARLSSILQKTRL